MNFGDSRGAIKTAPDECVARKTGDPDEEVPFRIRPYPGGILYVVSGLGRVSRAQVRWLWGVHHHGRRGSDFGRISAFEPASGVGDDGSLVSLVCV